jgi:HAMP domain-containing protein
VGEKPRWTRERVRVAEALDDLPLTRRGLETGELNWSSVRELTRVATPATEIEWLEAAKQRTARQLEDLVSGRRTGDLPSDPPNPRLERHVLSFEVSGEVLATFREAAAKLRREADGPMSEEEALLLMARQVLVGPGDAGKSSYQIAVTVCEGCGRGFQRGSGGVRPWRIFWFRGGCFLPPKSRGSSATAAVG